VYDVRTEGRGACGRRKGVSSMWTSIQKIRAHWRHPIFSCAKKLAFIWTTSVYFEGIISGFFPHYKLVVLITNSTVLNKLQWYYSRIHVDVHKEEWARLMWTHAEKIRQKSKTPNLSGYALEICWFKFLFQVTLRNTSTWADDIHVTVGLRHSVVTRYFINNWWNCVLQTPTQWSFATARWTMAIRLRTQRWAARATAGWSTWSTTMTSACMDAPSLVTRMAATPEVTFAYLLVPCSLQALSAQRCAILWRLRDYFEEAKTVAPASRFSLRLRLASEGLLIRKLLLRIWNRWWDQY